MATKRSPQIHVSLSKTITWQNYRGKSGGKFSLKAGKWDDHGAVVVVGPRPHSPETLGELHLLSFVWADPDGVVTGLKEEIVRFIGKLDPWIIAEPT